MNPNTIPTLVGIAFVLGYYYGRSSQSPGLNKSSRADKAPSPGTIHDTLEEEKDPDTKSESSECCSMNDDSPPETMSNSAAQEDEDIEDETQLRVARFSPDGELVIESAAIAARKNAADLNRQRRVFREAQAG